MANPIHLRDRFLGCILGGAVGDALGAPYEGLWSHSIPDAEALLSGFAEFEGYPRGQYTDDTQLSIATVEAILREREWSILSIAQSISRLWETQSVVGPGGACTHAAHTFLRTGNWSTCGAAVGQAGNGTAMRTAAVGLYFVDEPKRLPAAAADVSRITHQDPRSIAGGVAVAKAAQLLTCEEDFQASTFCEEVADAMQPYEAAFAEMVRRVPDWAAGNPATALQAIAWSGMQAPEFDSPIITPFVIPTVLAAFWCLLKHPDTWSMAVTSAIRLGGDVDTLGAIVGALAGVKHGLSGIPAQLVEDVLDSERLHQLALRYYSLRR